MDKRNIASTGMLACWLAGMLTSLILLRMDGHVWTHDMLSTRAPVGAKKCHFPCQDAFQNKKKKP